MNIFDDVERNIINMHIDTMQKVFNASAGIKDIDEETGKISEYHRDNCSGCALCEE